MLLLAAFSSCSENEKPLVKVDEVAPWCILGFDSMDRNPEQRIAMLKEMGFKKYGFNKGKGHLDEMIVEFQLALENNIEITSVFLWLNAKRDSLGAFSESNQQLLDNLRQVQQRPIVWLSFSDNYFKGRNQVESKSLAVDMIEFVKSETDELGCKLALYNHHGWFGNPRNQLEIMEELQDESISMVYNFHHAQDYVDDFPELAKRMAPYLSYVNLNGVKKDGPQIVPIGEGDHELEMILSLKKAGFNGPWGILGHIKTEDVQVVLQRNIDGLEMMNKQHIKNAD